MYIFTNLNEKLMKNYLKKVEILIKLTIKNIKQFEEKKKAVYRNVQ